MSRETTNRIHRTGRRMISGRLSRELLGLSFPVFLQSLCYTLLGLIDRVMVGQLGEDVISGVGVGNQVNFLLMMVGGSAAAGTSILTAQYRGAKNLGGVARLTGTSLWMAALVSSALAGAIVFLARPICLQLADSEQIAEVGASYLSIVTLTLPMILLMFVITGIMKALGDTRTPMYTTVVAICLNTLGNWLLIFGVGPFPELGYVGAAWSTFFSHTVAFGLTVAFFMRKPYSGYRFALTHLKEVSLRTATSVMKLAMPIAGDMAVWQFAMLAYIKVVSRIGPQALAAYFIYMAVRSIGFIPMSALSQGVSVIVGREIGAVRPKRFQAAVGRAVNLALAISALMAILFILIAKPYVGIYDVDPEVSRMAIWLTMLFGAIIPFEGLIIIFSSTLRAGGDALRVSVISFSSFWLVGVPLAWFFGVFLHGGMLGAFIGIGLESVAKACLFVWRYRGGKWVRNLTD
ncbi:MATE family efflux transporter [bacterium]|nr:MATE family efflux transporter [bacterium]